MNRVALVAAIAAFSAAIATAGRSGPRIQVIPHELAPRVDVLVEGKPFTTYVHLHSLLRPALEAVRSAGGAIVLYDGLWFGEGDANGIDFSGNGPADGPGRIAHRRVIEASSSDEQGQLAVEMTWGGRDDTVVLVEDTRFVFRDRGRIRSIDRATRLNAVHGPVRFGRSGRGLIGLHLVAALAESGTILDRNGRIEPAAIARVRRPWLAVSGAIGPERVTVALLDHPANPGFPGAWRLGRSGLLELLPTMDEAIDEGRAASFRHRLVVFSGPIDAAAIEREYERFSAPAAPERSRAQASGAPLRTDRLFPGS